MKKKRILMPVLVFAMAAQTAGLQAEEENVRVTGVGVCGGEQVTEPFETNLAEGETADPEDLFPASDGYVFTGKILSGEYEAVSLMNEDGVLYLLDEEGNARPAGEDAVLQFILEEEVLPEEEPVQTEEPAAEPEVSAEEEIPEEAPLPEEKGPESPADSVREYLDADEIYVDSLSVSEMRDGIGPFDAAEGDGRDTGDTNRIVRTFDTVTYTLSYRTRSYGVYDSVRCGYMYYEMVLPLNEDEAVFDPGSMPWAGVRTDDLSSLSEGTSGYTYGNETRETDGGARQVQVLRIRRFMGPNDTAENAFPGSGTVSAVVRVLGAGKGTAVQPLFRAWMEHNDTEHELCETHGRKEIAEAAAEAVTVTCELRMNAVLVKHTHTEGLDTFDFSSGNELAQNRDKGNVKGRIFGFGVILQIYNRNDAGTGADLKGCAIPDGPLQVSVDLNACYRMSAGGEVRHMNDEGFVPLLWSYEGNKRPYSDEQADGRDVRSYGLTYVTLAPLNRKNEQGDVMPADGSNGCWDGGDWNAVQNGNRVTFTIQPKSSEHPSGYSVNPAWFPNGNAGAAPRNQNIYWNPADGVFTARVGCISAGEVYVVVPYEADGKDIASFYGDTGTVELTASDLDLRAVSGDGDLPADPEGCGNQGSVTDDVLSWTTFISGSGVYTPNIHYAAPDGYGDVNQNEEPGSFLYSGEDAVAAGQYFGMTWGLWCDPKGDSDNMVYAVNSLLKFDDEAIELKDEDGGEAVPRVYSRGYLARGEYTWMFAAKPDGSGWQSDEEMNAASEDDLIYYDSLDALREEGAVCVGILMQFRKDLSEKEYTNKGILSYIPCRIDDVSLAGNVYQIRIATSCWMKDEILAAGGSIPLRPQGTSDPSFSLPDSRKRNVSEPYVKAEWEDGAYTGGHTGDNHDGDSVYVTPFRSEIEIRTAQTLAPSGEPARIYSYDAGQRFVEYCLTPSLKTYTETGSGKPVNAYIEVTLPCGLAFSDAYGSVYAPMSGYHQAGVGKQGTVDGVSLPAEAARNADGTTTLRWTLEDIVPGQQPEHIFFGCTVGDESGAFEIQDQQDLTVTAVIRADGDRRPLTPENENISEAGIRISKQLAMAVAKRAEKRYIDPGEDAEWTVTAGNNGASDLPGLSVADVFPVNEENGMHRYTGEVFLKEFRVLSRSADGTKITADNIADWEVWYTESAAETAGMTASPSAGEIRTSSNWQKAAVRLEENGDLVVSEDLSAKKILAAAVICDLKAAQTCRFRIVLSPRGIRGGESLKNTVYRGEDSGTSVIYTASRTISGLVFLDGDLDGLRTDEEELLSGFPVTLLKKHDAGTYETCTDASGDPVTVCGGMKKDVISGTEEAGEPGSYAFTGLSEGIYAVRLTDPRLRDYVPSPLHAGDPSRDSDGEAVYEEDAFTASEIRDITMPAAAATGSGEYVSGANDFGLGRTKRSLTVRKVWKNGDGPLPEYIRVTLYGNDSEAVTYTLRAEDAVSGTSVWQIQTEDLPVFDQSGKKITYSLRETEVAGSVKDEEEEIFHVYGKETENAGSWIVSYETGGNILSAENTWKESGSELTGGFSFTVEKCGTEDRLLSGEEESALFTLYEKDEEGGWVTREEKRTEEGRAEFTELPEGEYLLKETEAPYGYLAAGEGIGIRITTEGSVYVRDEVSGGAVKRIFRRLMKLFAGGQNNWTWNEEDAVLRIRNEQVTGRIAVTKTVSDAEEKELRTETVFRFGICRENETQPIQILAGKAGTLLLSDPLPQGTYRIRELAPLDDDLTPVYVRDNTVYSPDIARIDTNGQTVNVQVRNVYRRASLVFRVKKEWEGMRQDSAVFDLYAGNSTVPAASCTLREEDNWEGSFPAVPEYTETGEKIEYRVAERPVPGYVSLIRTEGTETVCVNRRIRFAVRKTDADGVPLSGAVLQLVGSGDSILAEWSDSEVMKDLSGYLQAGGSYRVREKSAPAGYGRSSREYAFTVSADGEVSGEEVSGGVLTVVNRKTALLIEKRDRDTGKLLAGASLVLENESGEKLAEWQTGTSGRAFGGLLPGRYILRETAAPAGYQKASAVAFTLQDSDLEQVVIMYDAKLPPGGPKLPDTGDHSHMTMWMSLFGISLLIFSGICVLLKKAF